MNAPNQTAAKPEFPLRRKGNPLRFLLYLIVLPALTTVTVLTMFGYLLFEGISASHYLTVGGAHLAALLLLLLLIWVPNLLAVLTWPDWLENTILNLRNILLVGLLAGLAFPHALVKTFLDVSFAFRNLWIPYLVIMIGGSLLYLVISALNQRHTAGRDVRAGRAPQSRRYSERWIWFDTITLFLILVGIFIIELWFLAILENGEWVFSPEYIFVQPGKLGEDLERRMQMLAWVGCSGLTALLFFLWAGLGNRLMSNILAPVTFHERDVQGVILNTHRYLWHFAVAILLKYPFLLPASIILTFLFLVVPVIFVAAGQFEWLNIMTDADHVILAFGVFVAWLSPLVSAVVRPDETFGDYFNHRLANLLMIIQGHVVLVGFGNLGKRVLDRELRLLREDRQEAHFFEIVTPDVRLEHLCNQAVVIDRDARDVIYSGENNLLGAFGAVGACHESYYTCDPNGRLIPAEKRVLVPIVIGQANEAFISSRVNLERARLIIGSIPREDVVQTIFHRANRSRINAIISVSRSDQIAYFTYRARHRRIVLVYPTHNQGSALGYRLWAAIRKVQGVERLPAGEWPRILVAGNNKANHYMLETLWGCLPGNDATRRGIFEKQLAFLLLSLEKTAAHPVLEPPGDGQAFDVVFPAIYMTGGRHFGENVQGASNDIAIPARLVSVADNRAIERCISFHKPHILVVNCDNMSQTSLLLARCIRSIERQKTASPGSFRMPILLLSTARGHDQERVLLGDAVRYYDSLCKLYGERLALDAGYPAHARMDHPEQTLYGENIIDSLADAEEIIASAHRCFSSSETDDPDPLAQRPFVEISSCLPNRPGALAVYLARLSGLRFSALSEADFVARWEQAAGDGLTADSVADGPLLPSFQYLRNINLDPAGQGFAISSYAALVSPAANGPAFATAEDSPPVARMFANDGHDYRESPAGAVNADASPATSPGAPGTIPGVPDIIDRLTNRPAGRRNTIAEFREALFDSESATSPGKCACPGMNLCRVSAFQDFITASNNDRISGGLQAAGADTRPLLHASNYYASTPIPRAATMELPDVDTPYARIFCCSNGINTPGMLATVINTLLLKKDPVRREPSRQSAFRNINIDYFKEISCHNNHYSMNRLFGVYAHAEEETPNLRGAELQVHLIRILPIGGPSSGRAWFTYARMLHRFLDDLCPGDHYTFHWVDGNNNRYDGLSRIPAFKERTPREMPVAILIQRRRQPASPADGDLCRVCGIQPRQYDCHRARL